VNNEARLANADELNAAVADILAKRTTREWLNTLEPLGVLCAPINDYAAFREEPQVKAMDIYANVEQPGLGSIPMPRQPGLSQTPQPSPLLGEHTKGALKALGLSEAEIQSLIDARVVQQRHTAANHRN